MTASRSVEDRLRQAGRATHREANRRTADRPPVEQLAGLLRRRRLVRGLAAAAGVVALVAGAILLRSDPLPVPEIVGRPPAGPTPQVDEEAVPARRATSAGWSSFPPGGLTGGADGLQAVGAVGGRLVAVGTDAASSVEGHPRPGVWLSTTGRDWQAVEAAAIDDGGEAFRQAGMLMHDVAAIKINGQARLVAVGQAVFEPDSRLLAWISNDQGETWQLVEVPAGPENSARLQAVAATEQGLVAVGGVVSPPQEAPQARGLRPAVWTSPDGQSWSQPHLLEGMPGVAARDVATSGGQTVAVGGPVTSLWAGIAWTSPDGQSWTARTVVEDATLHGVAATPNGGFLAVGSTPTGGGPDGPPDADGILYTSPDGRSWIPVPDPDGVFAGPGNQQLVSVATDQNGQQVAAGTDAGHAALWIAPIGRTWKRIPHRDAVFPTRDGDPHTGNPASAITDILPTGSAWVAVGSAPGADTAPDPTVWLHPGATLTTPQPTPSRTSSPTPQG